MAETALARAEALRQSGRYAEAAELFRSILEELDHPDILCGLANCLRHLGKPEEALELLEGVRSRLPRHEWARREWVWAVYKARLAPAVAVGDVRAATEAARSILDAGAEGLARKRACLAAARAARTRKKWSVALEWTSQLDPEELDASPRHHLGKTLPSEREQWAMLHVRSLLETGRHDEAVKAAERELSHWPNQPHLRRWRAVALARLGQVEEALQELDDLCARAGEWYNFDALAEVAESAGEIERALGAAARALCGKEPLPSKVNVLERFARLSLAAGSAEDAFVSARLAEVLRKERNWPVRESLRTLVRTASAACRVDALPAGKQALLRRARAAWERRRSAGRPRSNGVVVDYKDGRRFAFIRNDAGERIFVMASDLPAAARRVGAEVSFALEPSFDRKRNRRSVRATDVRLRSAEAETEGSEPGGTARKAASERATRPARRLGIRRSEGPADGERPDQGRQGRLDL
ncbi:MAG: hypothetical protein D6718_13005 [Acidobacteria bacterium]|nr:MAG: hypothetical protein D6718_13005 [Acidobacteriota bacterium]